VGERLKGKTAIVVGAGQTPGETIGNGRATAITFAREGARVLLVDKRLDSAEETARLIAAEGGECFALRADIREPADCAALAAACIARWGRIDVLHNNVGVIEGDSGVKKLGADAFDRIYEINLRGVFLCCQAVLPHMEAQGSGSIINISSAAAVIDHPLIAYKTTKAGLNALTHALAMSAAKSGVRVNAIMPGAIRTPMAIEGIAHKAGIDRETLNARRDAVVPLKGGQGSAWDIANAALFLASDEARFITAVVLPVDGGQSARIG
jgi:NAD(P)-dependent dehydrogenase (short-subunit alcohol dehydrogenase family)